MIQKFVGEEGKKYVTDGVIVAEIAPFDVVEQIEEEHEVKLDYNFNITPQKVHPGDKLKVEGFVEAPDVEGEYKANFGFQTQGFSWKAPNIAQFTVEKKDKEQQVLTVDDIKKLIKQYFGKGAVNKFMAADPKYKEAWMKDIQKVLGEVNTDQLKYKATWADCDDYSYAMEGAFTANPYKPEWQPTVGQAIFIIWVYWKENDKTYAHALNCMVTRDEIKCIEPQNKKILKVPEKWNLILMQG